MENYKYSIPVKIKTNVDESTLSVDTIEDLLDLQDMYDINLEDVIDECECALESSNSMDDDEDYYYDEPDDMKVSKIISDNWKGIMKTLNREDKLEDVDDEDINTIFNIVKEDLEKNVTPDKFTYPDDKTYEINSIQLIGFNKSKSEIYINFEVNNKLNKEEIEHLRTWLENEMYEEWGDDFSDNDLAESLNKENMYVYFIPWSTNKDIKYVKQ